MTWQVGRWLGRVTSRSTGYDAELAFKGTSHCEFECSGVVNLVSGKAVSRVESWFEADGALELEQREIL